MVACDRNRLEPWAVLAVKTIVLVVAAGAGGFARLAVAGRPDVLNGVVVDMNGPVGGAVVRVQTTDTSVTTDAEGRFTFTGLTPGKNVSLSAWAPGYFIAGGDVFSAPRDDIRLRLVAFAVEDNPGYEWISSLRSEGKDRKACAECHSSTGTEFAFTMPADEWQMDAHAQSAFNPRFLSMYNGTDLTGNRSAPTRYAIKRDYGRIPLPPEPNEAYYGPGYKLDFPSAAGNCAACHVPAAAVHSPYGTDPNEIAGVGAEGIGCDFCHKIVNIHVDPKSRMPDENMPGVLSMEFRRPPVGKQFFAGPLDDVAPGNDTYSPLYASSQFCASCHFGAFWGTVVYNSFGEWLKSPYSDSHSGKTCQDCHMPRLGASHFALPEKGGRARDPATIFSHRMPGAADETLLQNSVSLEVASWTDADRIRVDVAITNDQAGHHVPTGSPLRHLLLLVQATDVKGRALAQITGDTIPTWGGVGDSKEGAYAGLPGKAFAKILEEHWTGVSPTAAYWNPTRVISDNRIAALHTDRSSYTFRRESSGATRIHVRLFFRRAFFELQKQKKWRVPDVLMEEAKLVLEEPSKSVGAPIGTKGVGDQRTWRPRAEGTEERIEAFKAESATRHRAHGCDFAFLTLRL